MSATPRAMRAPGRCCCTSISASCASGVIRWRRRRKAPGPNITSVSGSVRKARRRSLFHRRPVSRGKLRAVRAARRSWSLHRDPRLREPPPLPFSADRRAGNRARQQHVDLPETSQDRRRCRTGPACEIPAGAVVAGRRRQRPLPSIAAAVSNHASCVIARSGAPPGPPCLGEEIAARRAQPWISFFSSGRNRWIVASSTSLRSRNVKNSIARIFSGSPSASGRPRSRFFSNCSRDFV